VATRPLKNISASLTPPELARLNIKRAGPDPSGPALSLACRLAWAVEPKVQLGSIVPAGRACVIGGARDIATGFFLDCVGPAWTFGVMAGLFGLVVAGFGRRLLAAAPADRPVRSTGE
jgi:hypothetical protein